MSIFRNLYLYLIILSLFSIFYTSLFYVNRMNYLKENITENERMLVREIETRGRFIEVANNYQIESFINYAILLKRLYLTNNPNLKFLIKQQVAYDFIAIITPNRKILYSSTDSFHNISSLANIPKKDSVFVSTYFDEENKITYKSFIMPIIANGEVPAYIIAHLNVSKFDTNAYYLLSQSGNLLNKVIIDGRLNNISFIFPSEWDKILEKSSGQFITQNGLFTYDTIDGATKVRNLQVFQSPRILLSIKPLDENSVYFTSGIKAFFKHTDFKINISYWIMGYVWIILTSILVYALILDKIKQGRFAYYDAMTGTLNRNGGYVKMERLFREYRAIGFRRFLYGILARFPHFRKPVDSIHLCMIDINGLKQVNDSRGHKVGDELILAVVSCLKKNLHKYEPLIRIGGDEFIVLFINRSFVEVDSYWEATLRLFENRNNTPNKPYFVSASYGVVECGKEDSIKDCIKAADNLMYQHKKHYKINLFFN